jgi:hypothetical protein
MKLPSLVIATIVAIAVSAFAGKEDREYMKTQVVPKVAEAEAKFKAACKCAMNIVVDEKTMKVKDQLYGARLTSESISEHVEAYCNDEASRKAMCQMKTLTLAAGNDTAFTFKGGTGIAVTDGHSHVDWDMITRELDK